MVERPIRFSIKGPDKCVRCGKKFDRGQTVYNEPGIGWIHPSRYKDGKCVDDIW